MGKYKLTSESISRYGHTLYRIVATRSFGNVVEGSRGGFVESEENLSQVGDAWISGNAKVWGNAQVQDDTRVFDNAEVFGNAKISGEAMVFGNSYVTDYASVAGYAQVCSNAHVDYFAKIFGHAQVYGHAHITDKSRIFENARVYGKAQVSDDAQVSGDSCISGDVKVFGNARLSGNAVIARAGDYITFTGFGSRGLCTTAFRDTNIGARINHNDFTGGVDDFIAKIADMYTDCDLRMEYKTIAELIRSKFLGK